MMRTTLSIDDDVLQVARELSQLEGRSLGVVLSALARRGLRPQGLLAETEDGFPVFATSSGSRSVTDEDVARALEEW